MSDDPLTKSEVEKLDRHRRTSHLWHLVNIIAAAFIPILVLSIMCGFLWGLVVVLTAFGYEVARGIFH